MRGVCKDWRNFVLDKKKLDLTDIIEKNINHKLILLFYRKKVKKLTISSIKIDAKLMSKVLNYYINLEELNLINISSYWSCFNNITKNKKLKRLNITSTREIYGYQIFMISNECKKIEALTLCYKYIVTNNILDMIFACFHNLNYLDIRNCPNCDPEYVKIKRKDYPKIEILN